MYNLASGQPKTLKFFINTISGILEKNQNIKIAVTKKKIALKHMLIIE